MRLFKYLSDGATAKKTLVESNPIRLMPGGLARIAPDGLHLLRFGIMASTLTTEHTRTEDYMRPISAEKLVYNVL